MLAKVLQEWGGKDDFWVFGYASLIWRPEFDYLEKRMAKVHGYHRALHMWSRVNRGTFEKPGLVFAMLAGGSCEGVVFKVPASNGHEVLCNLWQREMPTGVYDTPWLNCKTAQGTVKALAFTLAKSGANFTGVLPDAQYRKIFRSATGRYGTTLDYARQTYDGLLAVGIRDRALERLLRLA
jgi:glutathione-specific gamma-glutamylcyclotransferase